MCRLEISGEPPCAPATIDAQSLPRDVSALGGGKEKHSMGHFFDRASAAQRYVAEHSFGAVLFRRVFAVEELLCAFGQCGPRSNAIHQNSVFSQFDRQGPRQMDYAGLG